MGYDKYSEITPYISSLADLARGEGAISANLYEKYKVIILQSHLKSWSLLNSAGKMAPSMPNFTAVTRLTAAYAI